MIGAYERMCGAKFLKYEIYLHCKNILVKTTLIGHKGHDFDAS